MFEPTALLFILFAGLALGCAVSLVAQRNPLYCAISLIGVFVALAGLYILLAAPFIAAVQVIVYAGAIMVLVIFVIMLLNVEEEEHRPLNWRFISAAIALGAILFAEAAFVLFFVNTPRSVQLSSEAPTAGLTASIGTGLFTEYLLPFEITSVLILMAIVGAMSLARRVGLVPRSASALAQMAADNQSTGGGNLRPVDARQIIQPGNTEATGQAMAQMQIERGEAAAPAPDKEQDG
ncbi:MAG TPA: NADH-quinone oxidoreductase subunit J [Pyrinomonadaceae bacterium]|jgi:NADH-quinone oxidoreductase subunit J